MRQPVVIALLMLAATACRDIEQEPGDPESRVNTTGTSGTIAVAGGSAAFATSGVGVNLAPYDSSSPEWVSVDQMTQASDWRSATCADGAPSQGFETDTAGWISRLPDDTCVQTTLFSGQDGQYPAGTYVILSTADGAFEVSGDGDGYTSIEPGRGTFMVANPSRRGITLRLRGVEGAGAPQQVRVLMPGGVCGRSIDSLDVTAYCQTERGGAGACPTGQECFDFEHVYFNRFGGLSEAETIATLSSGRAVYFHPEYLARLQPYRTLRLVHWLAADASTSSLADWSERTAIDAYLPAFASSSGAPYALGVALANLLGAEVWVNIPHAASDTYARRLALYLDEHLTAGRPLYLEYSSRPWDLTTTQGVFIDEYAISLGLASAAAYQLQRTQELTTVWQAALAADRPSITVFAVSSDGDSEALSALLATGDNDTQIDVLAVDARFRFEINETNATEALHWSADDVLGQLIDGMTLTSDVAALAQTAARVSRVKEVADQYGLPLVAFSGGQQVYATASVASDATIQDLINAVNSSARMGAAMGTHLTNWQTAGGQLFIHAQSAGTWSSGTAVGALRYQTEDRTSAVKYRALVEFIEDNPCWWTGC